MNSHLDVSVLIVNWNTRDVVYDCLASIYEQTHGICFEVILVDNASSDGSVDMIKQEYPCVTLIENKENQGFASANNQAMEIARGRYVLLLNPDTIVLDGAIQKTVTYADNEPDIGVLGCQVWLNDKEIQKTCFAFPTISGLVVQKLGLRRLFPRSRTFGWIDYGWWDRTTSMDVDVVSGMFMLVRREVIDQAGIMDDAYFVYAEETDWCYRIKKANWRCVFSPVARIIHLDGGNKSTDLVRVKMFVQMQKSLLIFYRKHLGLFSWILAKTIYVISMTLRCIGFAILSQVRKDDRLSKKAEQSLAALKFHLFGVYPE